MIRVVHIVTLLELGGAQQNTLYTVTNLNRKIFQPFLLSGKGGYLDSAAEGISGLSLSFISSLQRTVNIFKDGLSLGRLWWLLRKIRPQIVHTHSSKAGILGRWAAYLAGVPLIIHTYHGFGFNRYQKPWVRNFFIFLERVTAGITDVLVFVSRENWNEAEKLSIGAKDKYRLIRSGVKRANFFIDSSARLHWRQEWKIDSSVPVVGSVSCFKPQKNPLDLLWIARRVSQDYPDIVFLIAGDGELKPAMEEFIRENSLKKNCRLLGWQKDVRPLLAVSDVFILTSLWEGLPRVLLEAQLAGLPAVVYAVDGIKEVIRDGENGFLIPAGDREMFSRRLLQLCRDPILRRELAGKTAATVDKSFDIDYMVEQQEELYQQLVKGMT